MPSVVAPASAKLIETSECFQITPAMVRDAYDRVGCNRDFGAYIQADRRTGEVMSACATYAVALAAHMGVEALSILPDPVLRPRMAAKLGTTPGYLFGFNAGWFGIDEQFAGHNVEERRGFIDGQDCRRNVDRPGPGTKGRCF